MSGRPILDRPMPVSVLRRFEPSTSQFTFLLSLRFYWLLTCFSVDDYRQITQYVNPHVTFVPNIYIVHVVTLQISHHVKVSIFLIWFVFLTLNFILFLTSSLHPMVNYQYKFYLYFGPIPINNLNNLLNNIIRDRSERKQFTKFSVWGKKPLVPPPGSASGSIFIIDHYFWTMGNSIYFISYTLTKSNTNTLKGILGSNNSIN